MNPSVCTTLPVTKLSFLSSTVVLLFLREGSKHARVVLIIAFSWAEAILRLYWLKVNNKAILQKVIN